MAVLYALTQKRIVLNASDLFWVSAQSIVKAPSKFSKLRFSEQVTSLLFDLTRFFAWAFLNFLARCEEIPQWRTHKYHIL